MSDQILKAKDDLGTPHDTAGQLSDGSWGIRFVGELTPDQVLELQDIVDRSGRLLGHVTVDNAIALDPTTLAALETISISNFPSTQAVNGTVALDSTTLAALETISVSNFPSNYDISDRAGRLLGVISGTVSVSNMIPAVETGLNKEVTQALIYARLADIKAAVEAIAIDADTIAIDSDTINLSTDQLEDLLQQIRDQDTAAYADQATAANQEEELAKLDEIIDALAPEQKHSHTLEMTTALTANEVYTSPWYDITNWSSVNVFALFFQAKPTRVRVQWSDDGSTILPSSNDLDIVASINPIGLYTAFLTFNAPVGLYYRIVVTNGATAQSANQLHSWRLRDQFNGVFKSMNAPALDYEVALFTRSVQAGLRFDGTFANVQVPEHDRDLHNEQVVPFTNGAPVTFTVDEPNNKILSTAHGLVTNKTVHFTTTGTLPAPLTTTGHYSVVNPTADDFQVALTRWGTPINITDTGTGTHSYSVADKFSGAYTRVSDVDHFEILYASLTPLAYVEKVWSGDGVRDLDRVVTDGVLNGTTTLTSATAFFTRYDQGSTIVATGVPTGTVIVTVNSATSVTLSQAATVTATGVEVRLDSPFSPSAIAPQTIQGYNVYYDVNEGRNLAPFYRLHVVNGVSNQSLFPGFIAITWLQKTPYQGSFGLLEATLNQLSRALLVRSVQAGVNPDGSFINAAIQGRHTANSTTTPLGANGIFRGTWFSWQEKFVGAVIDMKASHTGTLYIDFSSATVPVNGDESSVDDSIVAVYDPLVNPVLRHIEPIQSRWVRVRYVNDATPQTTLLIDTAFVTSAPPVSQVRLDNALTDASLAGTQRSVIAGRAPDGLYRNLPAGGPAFLNTTTTPLDADEEWVGEWERSRGYVSIGMVIATDVPSTNFGVLIEFSDDASTVRNTYRETYSQGDVAQGDAYFKVENRGDYFRVRYQNGPAAQTSFFLEPRLNTASTENPNTQIESPLSSNRLTTVTRSVITGKDPNDDYENVRRDGKHAANSSEELLDANEVYRGDWFEWQGSYIKLVSTFHSDVDGVLFIDFTEADMPVNGVDDDVEDFVEIEYDADGDETLQRRQTPVQSRWVRHRYVNGNTAQSVFHLLASFVTSDPGLVVSSLARIPTAGSEAGIVRNIPAVGDGSGGYHERPVDDDGIPTSHITVFDPDLLLRPLPVGQTSQRTVDPGSATRLDPVPLANRRSVALSNMDTDNDAVIGFNDSLSATNGFPLPAGRAITLMASDAAELWGRSATAGTSNTQTLNGSTASGTGTNTVNAESANSVYANISGVQTVDIGGYSITPTLSNVAQVLLRCIGKKQASQFQTVAAADATAFTGTAGAVGSVSTSSSVTGGTAQTYLAFIARNSTHVVSGVTGLGLTWTQVISQTEDDSNRRLDCWEAHGTATTGVVTASFATLPTNSAIDVLRFTGVDQTTPVEASGGNTANTTVITAPTVAGTNKGMAVIAVTNSNRTSTPGTGYTERSDHQSGILFLATNTKPLVSTGNETGSDTLSGGSHECTLAITLLPAAAIDPSITLSYSLSGTPGATTENITFTSTSNATTDLDISGDAAFTFSDVPNIHILATGLVVGDATADIDALQLIVIETSGSTVRIGILELA